MARFVTVEEHGDVALVRVDRPPANALDLELLEQGSTAVSELRDSEPGAVVLTGREGFFSAGVDLKVAPTLDPEGQRGMVDGINRLFLSWYSFPRPLVCAVNGHAIAGGLILALCGDHRVGAGVGKLGLTELRAGIPYPAAAMAIVRAELPPPSVRALTLHADLIDSDHRAVELGLLDELCAPDDLIDRCLEVAGELAALPRGAYARVKDQLRGATVAKLEAVVADDPMRSTWLGDETAAASAAILDRGPRPT
ncbi:MAG TPA: enoyl-CoA hydratase/isomerase family protein [Thermoleophilaceae bacterium]|nr:enoyl-CoA hydratase/isomerase family protein [Thermoleophilaceae bacterium]